ncbi:zinc ABC transporter substrate-binding protein [Brevibacillus laterosporus]|uniref:Manganese transporter n=2 Tax=Brevibacillus TaxID=55080 RepID=A0A0F7EHM9_BRELA|nr:MULTISPECIES: zinc ABC transporter substrate-binding protein [Brevibacillus]AKF95055.1 manganese transporter [Brevibacillus laterosporus]MCR8986304.1 zinc ABC transporter substrate-binding protein [Brevibacillus laterosporus]MCZ0832038.1 zinc ABC transporter substrate-binding protein [Brevibacillus halotolerans]
MQLLKKQRWVSFLSASVLALSLMLTGCGQQATSGDTQKPQHEGTWKITTTTGMVADIVAKVGGDQVEVTQLMGAGVDPHLYKASQGDIKRIEDADIVFYSGLHLEGKMVDIFEQISKKKPVIAVTKQIPKELLHADPESPDQPDPHVWFDVSLWMKAVEQVRDSLSEIDTLHKDMYHTNATNYLKQLQELHDYAKEQVATVPKEQRVLVTAHDAFAYFGKAYDIEVVGLQGISTASEYGLKDVQNLVTTLVDRKIKAVFVESSVPKRSIEAVVEGASAKNHNVVIGGELFSDAMGTPGTPEGNYIGMVKHNVDTIVSALK